MAFSSIAGLLAAAEGRPLWEAVLEEDLRDRGVRSEERRVGKECL